MPYELIVIGSNNNKTMSSFIANVNILSGIATILTPIFQDLLYKNFLIIYYLLY